MLVLVRGASGTAAASMSAIAGSSAQAISIRSAASSAKARDVATTATTASPCQKASSVASGLCGGDTWLGTSAKRVCQGAQTGARSSAVNTATTPGMRLAALNS